MDQNCHILTIPVVGNPNTLLTSFNRDSKPLQPLSLESYLKDSFVLPGKGGNCENTYFCVMSHHLHPTGRDAPDGDFLCFTFSFAWSLVFSESPCLVFSFFSCSGKNWGRVAYLLHLQIPLGDLFGEKILMQEHIVAWFPVLTT